MQRDVMNKGFTISNQTFNLKDDDVQQITDYFTSHPEAVEKVNNTFADLRKAAKDHSTLGEGEKAPRSMIQFCDEEALKFTLMNKVMKMLETNEELQWIIKTRPIIEFTVLRSLPGLVPQFWHRDYTFKLMNVKEMLWEDATLDDHILRRQQLHLPGWSRAAAKVSLGAYYG
jgi:hypothetical protein